MTKQGIMKRGLGLRAMALVALAAIVALVAVAVSSGPAKAAEVALTTNTATVQPGDTVTLGSDGGGDGFAARIVRYTIDTSNSTSTGSFASGGGQTVACSDGGSCDTDEDEDQITVKLNVDADSPDGFIIVTRATVVTAAGGVSTDTQTQVITVTTQPKPATLAAEAAETTTDASTGSTLITASLKNDQSPAGTAGTGSESLTFITNLGTLNCEPGGTGHLGTGGAGTNVQACTVTTVAGVAADAEDDTSNENRGKAAVTLQGAGREGTATVTVTHAALGTRSATVTFFGEAKNLSAEAEQGSVHIGGSVFVVLTVTDDAGNPVSDARPQPSSDPQEVVGPSDDSNEVGTSKNTATPPTYNVNKDVDGDGTEDMGDIPACGPVAEQATAPVGDGDPPLAFESTGTNDAGQCVVQVNAPADDDTTADRDESATRGVHTLNFELAATPDPLTALAQVTVAGIAHSIATDPADGSTVEPLSDNTITITVTDDAGVLVGATDVDVVQVAGAGLTEGLAPATGDATPSTTDNGEASFDYIAGLGGDQVVFRIRAGSGDDRITDVLTLNVGEPEVVEPVLPALVELSDGAIATFVGWRGGETTAAQVFDSVPNLTVVWKYDGTSWHSYVSAADAPGLLKNNFSLAPYDSLFIVTTGPVTVASGY